MERSGGAAPIYNGGGGRGYGGGAVPILIPDLTGGPRDGRLMPIADLNR